MFRRTSPAAPAPLEKLEMQLTVAVRESLIRSYPAINVDEIVGLINKSGMNRLPDPLFLEGAADDDSATGLRSRLHIAGDSEQARSQPLHPLFSTTYYDFMYPSVKDQEISPWVHFHVFGATEGLSPHFLLDVDYLGHSSAHLHKSKRIDNYLLNREDWFRASSPYVDVERFIISGNWDRSRHPLVSILTSNREWIQDRLMVVDSNWGEDDDQLINAAGYLLNATAGEIATRRLIAFATATGPSESMTKALDWRVIPGVFIGADGAEPTRLSAAVLSPDLTMVRVRSGTVLLAVDEEVPAERLILLESDLSLSAIDRIWAEAAVTDAIAPFSPDQEVVLVARARSRRGAPAVLKWGRQVSVPSAVLVRHREDAFEPPVWTELDVERKGTVFYLNTIPDSHRRVVESCLRNGAALCLVTQSGIDPWLPLVERAELVVTTPDFVGAVRSVVVDDRIAVLSRGGR